MNEDWKLLFDKYEVSNFGRARIDMQCRFETISKACYNESMFQGYFWKFK